MISYVDDQTASSTINNLLNNSNELAFEQSQNVRMCSCTYTGLMYINDIKITRDGLNFMYVFNVIVCMIFYIRTYIKYVTTLILLLLFI